MQGFFGKCLFAGERTKPKHGVFGQKKSGLQMGCVAIVALLRDLAADHSTPEQRVAVNAMCPMQDMSFETLENVVEKKYHPCEVWHKGFV